MRKKIIIFISIIMMLSVYSCAKKEPAKSPESDFLANKIAEQFNDLSTSVKLDDDNNIDLTKIENYSIRQSKNGETGIFKLYTETNAEYVKNIAEKRVSKLQESAESLENKNTANNAEVRSYGNYVYYVSHAEKDKIFKIIEDELKGA